MAAPKPDPFLEYLKGLDGALADGKITQAEYDLRKAQTIANATRRPRSGLYNFFTVVIVIVLVWIGFAILMAILDSLGSHA